MPNWQIPFSVSGPHGCVCPSTQGQPPLSVPSQSVSSPAIEHESCWPGPTSPAQTPQSLVRFPWPRMQVREPARHWPRPSRPGCSSQGSTLPGTQTHTLSRTLSGCPSQSASKSELQSRGPVRRQVAAPESASGRQEPASPRHGPFATSPVWTPPTTGGGCSPSGPGARSRVARFASSAESSEVDRPASSSMPRSAARSDGSAKCLSVGSHAIDPSTVPVAKPPARTRAMRRCFTTCLSPFRTNSGRRAYDTLSRTYNELLSSRSSMGPSLNWIADLGSLLLRADAIAAPVR
jgi:hypothetical protein